MCAYAAAQSPCQCLPCAPRPYILQYQYSEPWTTSWPPRVTYSLPRPRPSFPLQQCPLPASTWIAVGQSACMSQLERFEVEIVVRSLSGARGPGTGTPAEMPKATEPGVVALRRGRVEDDAASQASVAKSLPRADSSAAIEGGHSPYYPHLCKKRRTKKRTGEQKELQVGETSEQFALDRELKVPAPQFVKFLSGTQRIGRGRVPLTPVLDRCGWPSFPCRKLGRYIQIPETLTPKISDNHSQRLRNSYKSPSNIDFPKHPK